MYFRAQTDIISSVTVRTDHELCLLAPLFRDLKHKFRHAAEGEGDARSYTLISSNVTDRSTQALQAPGYEIGASVRLNVKGVDALAEALQKVQTGDTLTVIGADGLVVSAADYALIADGANKSGLKVSLQQAEQTPAA